MKKKVKKLALSRETLADLDKLDLRQAAGGAITQTCRPVPCEWSGQRTCTTCQLTCTTNYC
jgi:hypothetical protein